MEWKRSNKRIQLLAIAIIFVEFFFGCGEQPSILKKFCPAQAVITASQKIWVRMPKGGSKWMMQHDAYFILNNRKYPFRFICEIGSYNTADSIDVLYDPKRPQTVTVYSVPEKALVLADSGEYDHIYLNYDDAKTFFDSVHLHSKN